MTPKELENLEQLAKEMVAAKGSSVHTGLYMAYWRAADPQTVLTLIAASRERDALLKVVEEARLYKVAYEMSGESRAHKAVRDAQQRSFFSALEALAQHRGEADRGREE
jgi:glucosamine 6-phosphate synthetase-like amidotransferase/phosphosugar isomerase protein